MKIKYFSVFIIVYTITYLIFAYVKLEVNPLIWDQCTRVTAALFFVVVTIVYLSWVERDAGGFTYED